MEAADASAQLYLSGRPRSQRSLVLSLYLVAERSSSAMRTSKKPLVRCVLSATVSCLSHTSTLSGTGQLETLPAGIVFKSIGYKSLPVINFAACFPFLVPISTLLNRCLVFLLTTSVTSSPAKSVASRTRRFAGVRTLASAQPFAVRVSRKLVSTSPGGSSAARLASLRPTLLTPRRPCNPSCRRVFLSAQLVSQLKLLCCRQDVKSGVVGSKVDAAPGDILAALRSKTVRDSPQLAQCSDVLLGWFRACRAATAALYAW
jgi:hypothetical protein